MQFTFLRFIVRRIAEKKVENGVVLWYTNEKYAPPVKGYFPITTFLKEDLNEMDPQKRFQPTKVGKYGLLSTDFTV